MREPIGTTRKGQLILGGAGLTLGVGGGIGLVTRPGTFEPILNLALFAVSSLVRADMHYDPSQRTLFAILLPVLGTLWALLFAYAFAREPARNQAIDTYLRRKNEIDQSRRATVISHDDQPD